MGRVDGQNDVSQNGEWASVRLGAPNYVHHFVSLECSLIWKWCAGACRQRCGWLGEQSRLKLESDRWERWHGSVYSRSGECEGEGCCDIGGVGQSRHKLTARQVLDRLAKRRKEFESGV